MRLDYEASMQALLRPDLASPGGLWSVFLDRADPPLPLLLAECARLAYCRFEENAGLAQQLREALACAGYPEVGTFDASATGSRAFAAYDPARRSAVVAFRGTQSDNFEDLALDLQVEVGPWPAGGAVHAGFAMAARQIMPPLQSWLDQHAAGRTSLLLAGHSLGAALAVLAASCWAPQRVAAFGCPRVGDAQFARAVQSVPIDRYCNCCDLVCRLPPESPWYTHVGTFRYINRLGVCIDGADASTMLADRIAARTDYLFRYFGRYGNAPARELADHSMLNYLSAFL